MTLLSRAPIPLPPNDPDAATRRPYLFCMSAPRSLSHRGHFKNSSLCFVLSAALSVTMTPARPLRCMQHILKCIFFHERLYMTAQCPLMAHSGRLGGLIWSISAWPNVDHISGTECILPNNSITFPGNLRQIIAQFESRKGPRVNVCPRPPPSVCFLFARPCMHAPSVVQGSVRNGP